MLSHPEILEGKSPKIPENMTKEEFMRWGQIVRIFNHHTPIQIMEAAGFPPDVLKQIRNQTLN
jgi:hypothetical protein